MRKLLPVDVGKWLCVVVTGIIITSVFAGLGIVSVSADPGPTRSIVPDSVAQGESVDVTITNFITPKDFTFLSLVDRVPIGWNVTDMRANDLSIESAEAFSNMSNTTTGMVLFAWIGINSGISVQVDYTLHVPPDAEPGEYNLTGKLSGYYPPPGGGELIEWNATIPNGTVVVELNNTPPTVSEPSADPPVIPDDTDNEPKWGENSTLNVTVTDDSGIMSVTIDLSAVGGSATQPMTNIEGDVWSVTTNASNGTAGWTGTAYESYQLQVNATDVTGKSNISVSIPLTVMNNGDVSGNGKVTSYDTYHLAMWLLDKPGFEVIEEVADVSGNGAVTSYDTYHLAMWLLDKPGFELK